MTSPARRQYLDIKAEHPDAVLLYRLGDFYEMFDQDAEIAARVLGIQLTARSYPRGEGRVPMAGVPHHSAESYIKRLLDAGHRVALCEQMSEAGKGLVDRAVVRVFTPGTVIEPSMLEPAGNNFLAAVAVGKDGFGLAYADVSTGEFAATEVRGVDASELLQAELLRLRPAELLVSPAADMTNLPAETIPRDLATLDERPSIAERRLLEHLKCASPAAFGLSESPLAVVAAAGVVAYLKDTNPRALETVAGLHHYDPTGAMSLDAATRSSLELLPGRGERSRGWSLLRVLDRTRTAMGGRRLREMIARPLTDVIEIERRLDGVEALVRAPGLLRRLAGCLGRVADLERILARVDQERTAPRDLQDLRESLLVTAEIQNLLEGGSPALEELAGLLDPCPDLTELLGRALEPEGGPAIRPGYSAELDRLRALMTGARDRIVALERQEVEATGIKTLRIGYNRVFGYYLEMPKSAAAKAPDHYARQQTLVNAERFATPELKALEVEIKSAGEDAETLERQLIQEIHDKVRSRRPAISASAAAIGQLDVRQSLAAVALSNNYCRPRFGEGTKLTIRQGRHPIVEAANPDHPFVPNDCVLDEDCRIIVLTGPNMGGKSTMLRTVALVALMAQIGSYVPATEAELGVVDRIFSRVGAQDDIASGHSTFMVEMIETAAILHHATRQSLLVLDEIGRGTSTYDGVAIARAVVEYIHERIGSRTLFATHYHELTELAEHLEHVENLHTAVTEHEGQVVFLHRMAPGGADRSYGIHVARLAGLPHSVTVRADRLLRQLERNANGRKPAPGPQLALFADPDLTPKTDIESTAVRILDELLAVDLDNTTPRQALEKLQQLQERGRSSG